MLRGGNKSGKVTSCGHRNRNPHQTVPSLLYIWSGACHFQSQYTEYNIYGSSIAASHPVLWPINTCYGISAFQTLLHGVMFQTLPLPSLARFLLGGSGDETIPNHKQNTISHMVNWRLASTRALWWILYTPHTFMHYCMSVF